MQTRTITSGTKINVFTGKFWQSTKPTTKEITVEGAFTKHSSFRFHKTIQGERRLCSVDYTCLK